MSGVLSNNAYKTTFGNPGANAQGAIVAAMPAGSFVGALAVSKLADLIGRKWTIIISGWIWVIGSILQCASVVSPFVLTSSLLSPLRGVCVQRLGPRSGSIVSGLGMIEPSSDDMFNTDVTRYSPPPVSCSRAHMLMYALLHRTAACSS